MCVNGIFLACGMFNIEICACFKYADLGFRIFYWIVILLYHWFMKRNSCTTKSTLEPDYLQDSNAVFKQRKLTKKTNVTNDDLQDLFDYNAWRVEEKSRQ